MDTTELTPAERDILRMEVLVRTWSKVLLVQSCLAEGDVNQARQLLDDLVEEFPAHPEFEAVEAEVAQRLTDLLAGVQAIGSAT